MKQKVIRAIAAVGLLAWPFVLAATLLPAPPDLRCVHVEPHRVRCEARNISDPHPSWPRWVSYQHVEADRWARFDTCRGLTAYLDLGKADRHLVTMQPGPNWRPVRREIR